MKKILLSLLLVLAASVFAQNFESKEIKNFIIDVPEGWTINEDNPKVQFILFSPIEEEDTFRENCNVVFEDLNGDYTPKKYMQASISALRNAAASFKIIKKSDSILFYDAVFGNIAVRQIQFYYVKDSRGYVVTCSSTAQHFARFGDTFMKIGKSLKIKE